MTLSHVSMLLTISCIVLLICILYINICYSQCIQGLHTRQMLTASRGEPNRN